MKQTTEQRKKEIERIRKSFQKRLALKKENIAKTKAIQREPRYDAVYFEGTRILNEMAEGGGCEILPIRKST